jgi:iron complex transport system substrate-binding protein
VRPRITDCAFLLFILIAQPACGPTGDGDPQAAASLREPPARLVTLAPHLAELVHAVGAGDLLVGVSAYSDYPDEVLALPVIGDARAIDQERLALLDPDLILAWESGTPRQVVDELEKQGYRVESIRTRSLADVAAAAERIGELTGFLMSAREAATNFRSGIQALAERYSSAVPIRVFYQIQKRPLYSISGDHYVSELIGLCGGQNIFADLTSLAPIVAVEAVIERDPEVLLVSSDSQADALSEWNRWPDLAANRFGNRFVMKADQIGRPTLRLLIAGGAMCDALDHGRKRRDEYQGR